VTANDEFNQADDVTAAAGDDVVGQIRDSLHQETPAFDEPLTVWEPPQQVTQPAPQQVAPQLVVKPTSTDEVSLIGDATAPASAVTYWQPGDTDVEPKRSGTTAGGSRKRSRRIPVWLLVLLAIAATIAASVLIAMLVASGAVPDVEGAVGI